MENSSRKPQVHQDSSPADPLKNSGKISPMSDRLNGDEIFADESQVMEQIYRQEEAENSLIRKKKKDLYCFHCNRMESHLPYQAGWFHGFVTGLTLGINRWLGPFYCRCCGHRRLMFADWANPRFWWAMRRLNRDFSFSQPKKRSRSKRN